MATFNGLLSAKATEAPRLGQIGFPAILAIVVMRDDATTTFPAITGTSESDPPGVT